MNDINPTKTAKASADRKRPHTVAALAYDGVQLLDVSGPLEVFAEANVFRADEAYQVVLIGADRQARTSSGLVLECTPFKRWRGRIDTLIIPGGTEQGLSALADNTTLTRWLRRRIGDAQRVISVCTGAFVLAGLGCLNGRRVATHWGSSGRLQAFAPLAQVDADAIFLQDGKFFTSAGVTCGVDLTLALVEADHGRDVAARIARNLVLYLRRSGGQTQYSAPLKAQTADLTPLAKALRYVEEHPGADLSVDKLAQVASTSPRHFARLFSVHFGVGPATYVRNHRLDLARHLLEDGGISLSRIARRCGFSSADVMTRAFRKRFGVGPEVYRLHFGAEQTRNVNTSY